MVSVALLRVASRAAPPVGLESASRTVSLGSTAVSLLIATVKVLLPLSLSAQERVPLAGVKSCPAVAVPAVALYWTETAPSSPLIRRTAIVAVPAPSPAA